MAICSCELKQKVRPTVVLEQGFETLRRLDEKIFGPAEGSMD